MSTYSTKRLLKRYWRTDGNPRLKGLLLAGLDDGPSAEEVGQAWLTDAEERERQLKHVPSHANGGRNLKAPVTQQYAPASHEEFERSAEQNVARSLAKDELDEDDAKQFLAGETAMDKDRYIKRALLADSVTELDTLFREELETTLIQGAAPRKMARDAANVINVSRRQGDLPRGSDQAYAQETAQGAEIRTGDKGFDTVPYTATKYAAGWEITDELMRESEVDVMEALIRDAGAQAENAVNRVFLNELVDNAGQEHDTAGTDQDVTMVNNAIELVEMQNFVADSMVQHPEFKTVLFEDSNLAYANRAGSDDVVSNREFSPLLGLEMFTASDGTHNSDNQTWGFASDAEIGAVAYQREHMGLVIWDEFDMETKDYEDPIRDLQGGNVRTYCDAVWRQSNAAARVEF